MRDRLGGVGLKVAVVAAGLAAIFFVPYLFAHPDGHSQSYLAHYSNRAALMIFLLFTAGLAAASDGLGLRLGGGLTERAGRGVLFGAIGVGLGLTGVVWWLSRQLGAAMETRYFLDRYEQLALGLRLYRDLEFPYGPLMLYPQLGLARVLHVAVGDAHFAVLMVHWVLGLAALWFVCGRLAGSRRAMLALFVLLAGFWLTATVDGAMNYTPLRFLLGPAIALQTFALWQRGTAAWRVFGFALGGFFLLLFFSPEQGIAFALGTLLFFGALVRSRALVGPLLLFAVGCVVGLRVAFVTGELSSLLSFGGGALDYPLLPAATTITLLVGMMVGGAVAVGAVLRGEARRGEVYLAALTLFSLPAALGRCDPGHLLINGLPLIAIGFCALARVRGGLVWSTAVLGVFVLVSGSRHGVQYARMRVATRQALRAEAADARPAWPAEGRLLAPFGFVQALSAREPVPVFTGKYTSYRPLNDDVAREKLADLGREPGTAVLVPPTSVVQCAYDEELRVVELKFVFRPFWYPRARAVDRTPAVLCDYLAAHYRPGGFRAVGGEEVWVPVVGHR